MRMMIAVALLLIAAGLGVIYDHMNKRQADHSGLVATPSYCEVTWQEMKDDSFYLQVNAHKQGSEHEIGGVMTFWSQGTWTYYHYQLFEENQRRQQGTDSIAGPLQSSVPTAVDMWCRDHDFDGVEEKPQQQNDTTSGQPPGVVSFSNS